MSDPASASPPCVHRWKIPPPSEPAIGVCLYCGATREFDNGHASVWAQDIYEPARESRRAADFAWSPFNAVQWDGRS